MNELLHLLCNRPWAITQDAFMALLRVAQHQEMNPLVFTALQGGRPEIQAKTVRAGAAKGGVVMVIPVRGPLLSHASMLDEMFGFAGYDAIRSALNLALGDPAVSAVVLDFDSPGGDHMGAAELAAEILAARDVKPIVAQASGVMASAAYMLAASASEIVAQPSALVGSIGVILEHWDYSGMLEKEGVKVNLITAGEFKAELHPAMPMDDAARAHWQDIVNQAYDGFVRSVAAGRKASLAKVRSDYGQGRILTAQDALAAGMVDRIATLDQVLAKLVGKGGGAGSMGARERSAICTEPEIPMQEAVATEADRGQHPGPIAAWADLEGRR